MKVDLTKGTYIVTTFGFTDNGSLVSLTDKYYGNYNSGFGYGAYNLDKIKDAMGSTVSLTGGSFTNLSDTTSIVYITSNSGAINYSQSTYTWGSSRGQILCLYLKLE